jgi:integrase/recombinase XerC
MAIELKVTEAAPAVPNALEFLLKSKRSEVTRLAYQRDLRLFFRVVAGTEPTPQTVGAFFKLDTPGVVRAMLTFKLQQIEQGVAEVTLNRRLTAIRSLLSVARQLGLTEVISQGLVPGEKTMQYRDTRGVDKEAAAAMLMLPNTFTVKGKRDAAILRLFWELALRRQEICNLTRADFDPEAKTLAVRGKGKGTQKVLMTLSDKAIEAIGDYLACRNDSRPELFLSCTRDGNGQLSGITGVGLAFMVKHYARKAGIQNFSPHKWRHTSITAYLRATDGDVRGAQKLSRHAKLETLMIYDDAREDIQGRATRLLSELA